MKAVELTKDIPEQGLAKGDVIQVDELSAASMVKAHKAKPFDPDKSEAPAAAEPEEVEYGGQKVRTIDDIVDPDAKRMKGVMHVQRLVGPDPGPTRTSTAGSAAEAESTAGTAEQPAVTDTTEKRTGSSRAGRGASGANPAGGDAADGGAAS